MPYLLPGENIAFAGFPITVVLSFTLLVTIEPTPTMQFFPTDNPCRIDAFPEIKVLSPIVTLPNVLLSPTINTLLPIVFLYATKQELSNLQPAFVTAVSIAHLYIVKEGQVCLLTSMFRFPY